MVQYLWILTLYFTILLPTGFRRVREGSGGFGKGLGGFGRVRLRVREGSESSGGFGLWRVRERVQRVREVRTLLRDVSSHPRSRATPTPHTPRTHDTYRSDSGERLRLCRALVRTYTRTAHVAAPRIARRERWRGPVRDGSPGNARAPQAEAHFFVRYKKHRCQYCNLPSAIDRYLTLLLYTVFFGSQCNPRA